MALSKGQQKRAKEVELFYREKDSFDIHTKFVVGKELVSKRMVRTNALLLSVAAQFNDPTAVEIMKWLNDTTIISGSNDEKIWNTATLQLDDIRMKQRIVEFSRYADLGIENIEKLIIPLSVRIRNMMTKAMKSKPSPSHSGKMNRKVQ